MRGFISIVILGLLFLLTPVMFIVTSVRLNVATTDFLKQELVRLDVYDLATQQLDEQINTIAISPEYPITNAELATLAHQAVSAAWLRHNVETILDSLTTWLNSQPGTELNLPLDLRAPKTTLTQGIDALLTAKLPQIKPCPNTRQPKAEQGICQFSGLTLAQLKTELSHQGLNPDLVNQIFPDEINLVNPDLSKIVGQSDATVPNGTAATSAQIRHNLEQVKARYQQAQYLLNLALVIYGLVLALYLAINAPRGWHRLVRWGGVAFLVIGLIPLAMAVASLLIVNQVILPRIHLDPNMPAEIANIVPPLIRDVRGAMFNSLLFSGLLGVVLGLGGIVGAHWIRRVKRTEKE